MKPTACWIWVFAQDIETIAGETRWRKQTMLFSATLEGDAIKDFAERLLEEPVEVSANPSTRERKKIHQWYYRADDIEHKNQTAGESVATAGSHPRYRVCA
ncbi:ATP-dependent RNA helicase SrmB [Klebsiella pneumoniae]|uniref:ATP-dependent RNA helicase SrmB n=1 Tax=Klebsiella pneumoniae TaxID=573 RepID=A0A377XQT6_KLEPN|nr:ATP-dependent RNA helicase SrmB [Klebsiella pneumoniae]